MIGQQGGMIAPMYVMNPSPQFNGGNIANVFPGNVASVPQLPGWSQ